MSLTEVSFASVVKSQFRYKVKAYLGVFVSLMILQLIAIIFSFNGVSSFGSGSDSFSVTVSRYSANMVITFTFLWAFITAILLTTRAYRYDDFSFVTNRLSGSLSTVLFLLFACAAAGISAMLSSFLLKNIIYFFFTDITLAGGLPQAAPGEFIIGTIATILYVILFSSAGYFIGTLVQLHRFFAVSVPGVIFGSLFIGDQSGLGNVIVWINEFLFSETSFFIFISKIIIFSGIFFVSSFYLLNRLEVRQ
ncbi:hypothetical protein [Halalkalibacter flavus]|jgi:hypothetical protein|uniref:hypothetical protein n=1 Tax=Halalkalibacter flavus TaxID=3090668 RepID=UPI002FCBB3C1